MTSKVFGLGLGRAMRERYVMAHGYLKGGWREKYFIAKQIHDDQENMTGMAFVDPKAQYFVLRFDKDPHARIALTAYMDSVRADNAEFADDIAMKLAQSRGTEGGALERALKWTNADKE